MELKVPSLGTLVGTPKEILEFLREYNGKENAEKEVISVPFVKEYPNYPIWPNQVTSPRPDYSTTITCMNSNTF